MRQGLISSIGARKGRLAFNAGVYLLIAAFLFSSFGIYWLKWNPTQASASVLPYMPAPRQLVTTSQEFSPVNVLGLKLNADDPLKFDFIIDEGQEKIEPTALNDQSAQMIKYFLASLTIPKEDHWVNLSPYEPDRIVSYEMGQTDLGRDMLGEDYVLKQLSASMLYPDSPVGKKFWDKVYAKAYEIFGTTNVPINTFSRVWIVPGKITVYEDKDRAFIGQAELKVMLEDDYLALQRQSSGFNVQGSTKDRDFAERRTLNVEQNRNINTFAAEVMRQVVVPIIEEEVNKGKQFALLRQMYHAFILAEWYKQKLLAGIDSEINYQKSAPNSNFIGSFYANKKKIYGVDVDDPLIKEKIYKQYVKAFKEGAYDYVKKESLNPSGKGDIVNRRYYSGGMDWTKEEPNKLPLTTTTAENVKFIGWRTSMSFKINGQDNPEFLKELSAKTLETKTERPKASQPQNNGTGLTAKRTGKIASWAAGILATVAPSIFAQGVDPSLLSKEHGWIYVAGAVGFLGVVGLWKYFKNKANAGVNEKKTAWNDAKFERSKEALSKGIDNKLSELRAIKGYPWDVKEEQAKLVSAETENIAKSFNAPDRSHYDLTIEASSYLSKKGINIEQTYILSPRELRVHNPIVIRDGINLWREFVDILSGQRSLRSVGIDDTMEKPLSSDEIETWANEKARENAYFKELYRLYNESFEERNHMISSPKATSFNREDPKAMEPLITAAEDIYETIALPAQERVLKQISDVEIAELTSQAFSAGQTAPGWTGIPGLDKSKIESNLQPSEGFNLAVNYFNSKIIGNRNITSAELAALYELFSGNVDAQLKFTKENYRDKERAEMLKAINNNLNIDHKDFPIISILQNPTTVIQEMEKYRKAHPGLTLRKYSEKTPEDKTLDAIALFYSYIVNKQVFSIDGNHRLAWFLMNDLLSANGYDFFYFDGVQKAIVEYEEITKHDTDIQESGITYSDELFDVLKSRVKKVATQPKPVSALERAQAASRRQIAEAVDYHGQLVRKIPQTQAHATSSALVAKMIFGSNGRITVQPTTNTNDPGGLHTFFATEPAMDYAEKQVHSYGGQPIALIFDFKKLDEAGIRINPGGYSFVRDPDTNKQVEILNWDGYNEATKDIPLTYLTDASKREVVKVIAEDRAKAGQNLTENELMKLASAIGLELEAVKGIVDGNVATQQPAINFFSGLVVDSMVLPELEGLAKSVSMGFDEETFIEQPGLIVGAQDNGVFKVSRMIPLKNIASQPSISVEFDPADIRQKISGLKSGEQAIGLSHNHSHLRLLSNQRMGFSKEDEKIGEILDEYAQEFPGKISKDKIGLLVEPQVSADLGLHNAHEYNPADKPVLIYASVYRQVNAGYQMTLLNNGFGKNIVDISNVKLLDSTGDLGAQVSELKRMDRLLALINDLRFKAGISRLPADAKSNAIMQAYMEELEKLEEKLGLGKGFFVNVERRENNTLEIVRINPILRQHGKTGRKALVELLINRASGRSDLTRDSLAAAIKLARAIDREVVSIKGGVQAVNFQGTEGIWRVIGFSDKLTDKTLLHETTEISVRKQHKDDIEPKDWVWCHNETLRLLLSSHAITQKEYDEQFITEDQVKQYSSGQQKGLSAIGAGTRGSEEEAIFEVKAMSEISAAPEVLDVVNIEDLPKATEQLDKGKVFKMVTKSRACDLPDYRAYVNTLVRMVKHNTQPIAAELNIQNFKEEFNDKGAALDAIAGKYKAGHVAGHEFGNFGLQAVGKYLPQALNKALAGTPDIKFQVYNDAKTYWVIFINAPPDFDAAKLLTKIIIEDPAFKKSVTDEVKSETQNIINKKFSSDRYSGLRVELIRALDKFGPDNLNMYCGVSQQARILPKEYIETDYPLMLAGNMHLQAEQAAKHAQIGFSQSDSEPNEQELRNHLAAARVRPISNVISFDNHLQEFVDKELKILSRIDEANEYAAAYDDFAVQYDPVYSDIALKLAYDKAPAGSSREQETQNKLFSRKVLCNIPGSVLDKFNIEPEAVTILQGSDNFSLLLNYLIQKRPQANLTWMFKIGGDEFGKLIWDGKNQTLQVLRFDLNNLGKINAQLGRDNGNFVIYGALIVLEKTDQADKVMQAVYDYFSQNQNLRVEVKTDKGQVYKTYPAASVGGVEINAAFIRDSKARNYADLQGLADARVEKVKAGIKASQAENNGVISQEVFAKSAANMKAVPYKSQADWQKAAGSFDEVVFSAEEKALAEYMIGLGRKVIEPEPQAGQIKARPTPVETPKAVPSLEADWVRGLDAEAKQQGWQEKQPAFGSDGASKLWAKEYPLREQLLLNTGYTARAAASTASNAGYIYAASLANGSSGRWIIKFNDFVGIEGEGFDFAILNNWVNEAKMALLSGKIELMDKKGSISGQIAPNDPVGLLRALGVKDDQGILEADNLVNALTENNWPEILRIARQYFMLDGCLFAASWEMSGETLSDYLNSNPGAFSVKPKIIENLIALTDSLRQAGISHRDLKPQNIIVDPKTGAVALIDFGNAVSVQAGSSGPQFSQILPFGSLDYAHPFQGDKQILSMLTPEQAREFIFAQDIFSLINIIKKIQTGKSLISDTDLRRLSKTDSTRKYFVSALTDANSFIFAMQKFLKVNFGKYTDPLKKMSPLPVLSHAPAPAAKQEQSAAPASAPQPRIDFIQIDKNADGKANPAFEVFKENANREFPDEELYANEINGMKQSYGRIAAVLEHIETDPGDLSVFTGAFNQVSGSNGLGTSPKLEFFNYGTAKCLARLTGANNSQALVSLALIGQEDKFFTGKEKEIAGLTSDHLAKTQIFYLEQKPTADGGIQFGRLLTQKQFDGLTDKQNFLTVTVMAFEPGESVGALIGHTGKKLDTKHAGWAFEAMMDVFIKNSNRDGLMDKLNNRASDSNTALNTNLNLPFDYNPDNMIINDAAQKAVWVDPAHYYLKFQEEAKPLASCINELLYNMLDRYNASEQDLDILLEKLYSGELGRYAYLWDAALGEIAIGRARDVEYDSNEQNAIVKAAAEVLKARKQSPKQQPAPQPQVRQPQSQPASPENSQPQSNQQSMWSASAVLLIASLLNKNDIPVVLIEASLKGEPFIKTVTNELSSDQKTVARQVVSYSPGPEGQALVSKFLRGDFKGKTGPVCLQLVQDMPNTRGYRLIVGDADQVRANLEKIIIGQDLTQDFEMAIDFNYDKKSDTVIILNASLGGKLDTLLDPSSQLSQTRQQGLAQIFTQVADQIKKDFPGRRIATIPGKNLAQDIRQVFLEQFVDKNNQAKPEFPVDVQYHPFKDLEANPAVWQDVPASPFSRFSPEDWNFIAQTIALRDAIKSYISDPGLRGLLENLQTKENVDKLSAQRFAAAKKDKDFTKAIEASPQLAFMESHPDAFGMLADSFMVGRIPAPTQTVVSQKSPELTSAADDQAGWVLMKKLVDAARESRKLGAQNVEEQLARDIKHDVDVGRIQKQTVTAILANLDIPDTEDYYRLARVFLYGRPQVKQEPTAQEKPIASARPFRLDIGGQRFLFGFYSRENDKLTIHINTALIDSHKEEFKKMLGLTSDKDLYKTVENFIKGHEVFHALRDVMDRELKEGGVAGFKLHWRTEEKMADLFGSAYALGTAEKTLPQMEAYLRDLNGKINKKLNPETIARIMFKLDHILSLRNLDFREVVDRAGLGINIDDTSTDLTKEFDRLKAIERTTKGKAALARAGTNTDARKSALPESSSEIQNWVDLVAQINAELGNSGYSTAPAQPISSAFVSFPKTRTFDADTYLRTQEQGLRALELAKEKGFVQTEVFGQEQLQPVQEPIVEAEPYINTVAQEEPLAAAKEKLGLASRFWGYLGLNAFMEADAKEDEAWRAVQKEKFWIAEQNYLYAVTNGQEGSLVELKYTTKYKEWRKARDEKNAFRLGKALGNSPAVSDLRRAFESAIDAVYQYNDFVLAQSQKISQQIKDQKFVDRAKAGLQRLNTRLGNAIDVLAGKAKAGAGQIKTEASYVRPRLVQAREDLKELRKNLVEYLRDKAVQAKPQASAAIASINDSIWQLNDILGQAYGSTAAKIKTTKDSLALSRKLEGIRQNISKVSDNITPLVSGIKEMGGILFGKARDQIIRIIKGPQDWTTTTADLGQEKELSEGWQEAGVLSGYKVTSYQIGEDNYLVEFSYPADQGSLAGRRQMILNKDNYSLLTTSVNSLNIQAQNIIPVINQRLNVNEIDYGSLKQGTTTSLMININIFKKQFYQTMERLSGDALANQTLSPRMETLIDPLISKLAAAGYDDSGSNFYKDVLRRVLRAYEAERGVGNPLLGMNMAMSSTKIFGEKIIRDNDLFIIYPPAQNTPEFSDYQRLTNEYRVDGYKASGEKGKVYLIVDLADIAGIQANDPAVIEKYSRILFRLVSRLLNLSEKTISNAEKIVMPSDVKKDLELIYRLIKIKQGFPENNKQSDTALKNRIKKAVEKASTGKYLLFVSRELEAITKVKVGKARDLLGKIALINKLIDQINLEKVMPIMIRDQVDNGKAAPHLEGLGASDKDIESLHIEINKSLRERSNSSSIDYAPSDKRATINPLLPGQPASSVKGRVSGTTTSVGKTGEASTTSPVFSPISAKELFRRVSLFVITSIAVIFGAEKISMPTDIAMLDLNKTRPPLESVTNPTDALLNTVPKVITQTIYSGACYIEMHYSIIVKNFKYIKKDGVPTAMVESYSDPYTGEENKDPDVLLTNAQLRQKQADREYDAKRYDGTPQKAAVDKLDSLASAPDGEVTDFDFKTTLETNSSDSIVLKALLARTGSLIVKRPQVSQKILEQALSAMEAALASGSIENRNIWARWLDRLLGEGYLKGDAAGWGKGTIAVIKRANWANSLLQRGVLPDMSPEQAFELLKTVLPSGVFNKLNGIYHIDNNPDKAASNGHMFLQEVGGFIYDSLSDNERKAWGEIDIIKEKQKDGQEKWTRIAELGNMSTMPVDSQEQKLLFEEFFAAAAVSGFNNPPSFHVRPEENIGEHISGVMQKQGLGFLRRVLSIEGNRSTVQQDLEGTFQNFKKSAVHSSADGKVGPQSMAPTKDNGGIDLSTGMQMDVQGGGLSISLNNNVPFNIKNFAGFTFTIVKIERNIELAKLVDNQ